MSMMEEKEPITLKESSGVHSTDDSSDSRRQGNNYRNTLLKKCIPKGAVS